MMNMEQMNRSNTLKYPFLGRNLQLLRKRKGITQRQLAGVLGVTNKAVSAWEVGLADPRNTVLNKMSEYFGASREVLCYKQLVDQDAVQQELLKRQQVALDISPAPPELDRIALAVRQPQIREPQPEPRIIPPVPEERVRQMPDPLEDPPAERPAVKEAVPAFRSDYPDYIAQMRQLMQDMTEENKKRIVDKARLLLKAQLLDEFDRN